MRRSLTAMCALLALACGGGPPPPVTPSVLSAAVHLPLPDDVLDLELADRSGLDALVFARFSTLKAPQWAAEQGFVLEAAPPSTVDSADAPDWWRFAGGECASRSANGKYTQVCLEDRGGGEHLVLVRYHETW